MPFTYRRRLTQTLALASSLVLFTTSCTHEPVAESVSARQPASLESDTAREHAYIDLLSKETDPKALRVNYLDRILKIYYRAEIYVERFEESLDRVLKLQAKDPSYSENLLDTREYAKEMQNKALADKALDDIEFIYRRLLETVGNTTLGEKSRLMAGLMIADMYKWIDDRPDEDRLMLSDLLAHLEAVKKNYDVGQRESSGGRSVASVDFDFAKFDVGAKDMTPFVKAHRKVIHKKGMEALAWHDAEADSPAPKIEWNDRTPAGEGVIEPGLGVWGNVTGLSLPPNNLVFTFDDGPEYANDIKLIDILQTHRDPINTKGIPTTFFWMVKSVEKFPQSIPLAKKYGYTMNDHTWTHPDLMTQTPEQLQHEVTDANAYLLKAFGTQPTLKGDHFRFFRCPYGSCYQNSHAPPDKVARANVIRQKIADMGLIHAYWTTDSRDWALPHQNQRIFDITTKSIETQKRGVILMHDIHDWTIDTAQMIFAWIKDQNENHGAKYRLVNLETAVDEFNAAHKVSAAMQAAGSSQKTPTTATQSMGGGVKTPSVPAPSPANAVVRPVPKTPAGE